MVKLLPVFQVVRLSDSDAMLLASGTVRPRSKADSFTLEKIFFSEGHAWKRKDKKVGG